LEQEEIRRLFQEFYDSWYASLLRYVARSVGSVELAKDLVQESFLLLCKELLNGKKIENPKGWTFRVVRRQIGNYLRADRYSGVSFEPIEGTPGRDAGEFVRPALRVEADEEPDRLSRLMEPLSVREREVILLRLEGFRYKEIAEHLGIGSATVKTFLARALKKMQERSGKAGAAAGARAEQSRYGQARS